MKRALALGLVTILSISSFVEFVHADEHTSKTNKGCTNRSAHFEVPAAVVGACWMQALQNVQFVNFQISMPSFVRFTLPDSEEKRVSLVHNAALHSRGPPEASS